MTDALPVHVNREGARSVEVAPSFETTGSFALAVHNHGAPAHVHVRLEGDLSAAAEVAAANSYVEGEGTTEVPVTVETDRRPVAGRLEVSTAHGKERTSVAVEVVEPEEPVAVDGSLGRPADPGTAGPSPAGRSLSARVAEHRSVVALTALAALVAVVAVAVTDDLAVVVGALVVLAGIGAAALLLREPA